MAVVVAYATLEVTINQQNGNLILTMVKQNTVNVLGKKNNARSRPMTFVLTTSVNSIRPSVHERLVTPVFGNGFSAITSLGLLFVVDS